MRLKFLINLILRSKFLHNFCRTRENAAFFAAPVICCAMLALWPGGGGEDFFAAEEMPFGLEADEKVAKNSFIQSSSENVNPRAIFMPKLLNYRNSHKCISRSESHI